MSHNGPNPDSLPSAYESSTLVRCAWAALERYGECVGRAGPAVIFAAAQVERGKTPEQGLEMYERRPMEERL